MISNCLILNRLTLSLLIAISLPVALVGCQSTSSKNSTLTPNSIFIEPVITQKMLQTKALTAEKEIVVVDAEVAEIDSETALKATTLQWASNYDWQLTQVKDQKNNAINIDTDTPITLEVAPNSLSLSQGCQHFAINFRWMQAPPFEYGSDLRKKPSNCKTNPDKEIPKVDVEALFSKNSTFKLEIELLPLSINRALNTQIGTRKLVIKIENGNTLIFDEIYKPFKKLTGLPIDKALLERYKWRLVSAVRNTFNDKGQIVSRQPISGFYFPNHPISLEFRTSPDSPYVAFNSGCNGSSAPYFLLRDNTLKVSNILSSAMNCGETGNHIETALFDLMRNSNSQLTLSLQPSPSLSLSLSTSSKNQTDFPRYNLLQTMASGETLVWQNEAKKTP